ncbi:hypothetical protein TNCV_3036291 [Trichonephila clavipes]|nr:hypothetical protein TNCV_3036291 [Trichonephila clavipes]
MEILSNSRWNGDTQPLPYQGQSQTIAFKAEECGNSVLGPEHCFAGELLQQGTTTNSGVPAAQLYGSSEDYCKTNGLACCQKVFCSSTITIMLHTAPDLAPSDFLFFRCLKHSLGGKSFGDYEEVKTALNSWMSDLAAGFFEEGF